MPRPQPPDPRRIRRETRSESAAGQFIDGAAREVDATAARGRQGPLPNEGEAAEIAESPRQRVELYARVTLSDLETGERLEYTVVPDGEGDLAAGRVSLGSPVGRALFQEAPGTVVTVQSPGGDLQYRVLRVE